MSQVAIEKIHGEGPESRSLFEEIGNIAERIRQRAFELFQRRGAGNGADVDDWLSAERELIWSPASDLIDKAGAFELQVAVPGFDAKDVNVTALPDAIVIRAETTHRHDKTEGDVRFCEFGERSLFRRFDLPAPINVDKVTANVDKGVLKLTAAKANVASEKKIPAAA